MPKTGFRAMLRILTCPVDDAKCRYVTMYGPRQARDDMHYDALINPGDWKPCLPG
jgi:hypothetical protein